MSLQPGTRLGPYEIVSSLGAGGMGEVYRATDANLKRQVAIKVLPASVAGDADRLARFQREAEVLAALNHPNIAHIHGLERSAGTFALVMELVEGPTLADRIAKGAIPIDEALAIARQIAEALEAAHEQGIIHRDLKPANIKVRDDGTVKVLDFGLAKTIDPAAVGNASTSTSPTITTPAMTQAGMILGTAAYMSPEQAKGRAADKRSDVWAFGCLLYEMLTARRTFPGEDVSDTLALVLMKEPDWAALPANTPAAIRKLLARCLKKDRKLRLDSAAAARLEIDEILSGASDLTALSNSATAARLPLWRRAVPIATAVAITAVVAGAVSGIAVASRRASSPASVVRFAFMLPEDRRVTTAGRQVIAISPDGSRMAFVANGRLYMRRMSDLDVRLISGIETVQPLNPAFSPDGGSLVFFSLIDRTLRTIAVDGGAPVTICSVAAPPLGITWTQHGILWGQSGSGIMRVPSTGGKPELIVTVKQGEFAYGPQELPGGDLVLFTLAKGSTIDRWDNAQIVIQSLKSGERTAIVEGGSDGRYVPTGHIVYALGGTLFAVPFDRQRVAAVGGSVPIVLGIARSTAATGMSGVAQFSFSNNGTLAYLPGPASTSSHQLTLALFDRTGKADRLNLPPAPYTYPRISPDGTQVVVGTDDGTDASVWIYALAGTSSRRRLGIEGRNRHPIWSPDGEQVAVQSDREGDAAIFLQRADGTGTAVRLTKPEPGTSHVPESWFGDRLMYSAIKGSDISLWTFSIRERKAERFGDVHSQSPTTAVFSPDGLWVAYHTYEAGKDAVWVQSVPAGARYEISTDGSSHDPHWSRDGKELFYIIGPGQIVVRTVSTKPNLTTSDPKLLPQLGGVLTLPPSTPASTFDLTADDRIISPAVAQDPQSGPGSDPQIQVVLNWFEELKSKVPAK